MSRFFRRIITTAKRRIYYLKLVVTVFCVAIIPFLLFSFVAYHDSRAALEKQINQADWRHLQQTKNAIEIIYKSIVRTCTYLSTDTSISEFELFPHGSYYEIIDGPFSEEELPVLFRYAFLKSIVLERMNMLQAANEFVYSAYFIDTRKNLLLTDTFDQFSIKALFDIEWIDYLQDVSLSLHTSVRSLHIGDSEDESKKAISILYRSINFPANAFLINLDAERIIQGIIHIRKESNESSLFVLDRNNKIVLDNERLEYGKYFRAGLPTWVRMIPKYPTSYASLTIKSTLFHM